MEHKRMNGKEQTGLNALCGAKILLEMDAGEALKLRLKRLGLWWRWQGLIRQIKSMEVAIEESADPEQIKTLAKRAQHLTVFVGMDKIHDPEATYCRIEDISELAYAVLNDTCGLCVKDEKEARKCPLQKALRSLTTLEDKRMINGCMFREYTDNHYFGLDEEDEEMTL